MICDANLLVAGALSAANVITGQTVTGAGTTVSTNTVDLSTNRDIGQGADVYLRITTSAAMTAGTSCEIQAVVADDAALTTNVRIIATTGAIPTAQWTLGSRQALKLNPLIAKAGQRYLGARFVIVGASTAGAWIVDVGIDCQDGMANYSSGYSII